MIEFTISNEWRSLYPGASIGILSMINVNNPSTNSALDHQKEQLELTLRQQYAGYDRQALMSQPIFAAYRNYYKRFKKSYHVQLQLESVALKGKPIPQVAALVEAMFMAELKNHLLTAGHDRATLLLPTGIHVSDGSEQYQRINGQDQSLKRGDMFIADGEGIISSIIYGPDRRTRINPDTKEVLFTTYAPPGIDPVVIREHLQDIESYVHLIAPAAFTEALAVYGTEIT